jgi:hypothetical protein
MEANIFTNVVLPVALAVIMLGLGLTLTRYDFLRVVIFPEGVRDWADLPDGVATAGRIRDCETVPDGATVGGRGNDTCPVPCGRDGEPDYLPCAGRCRAGDYSDRIQQHYYHHHNADSD